MINVKYHGKNKAGCSGSGELMIEGLLFYSVIGQNLIHFVGLYIPMMKEPYHYLEKDILGREIIRAKVLMWDQVP